MSVLEAPSLYHIKWSLYCISCGLGVFQLSGLIFSRGQLCDGPRYCDVHYYVKPLSCYSLQQYQFQFQYESVGHQSIRRRMTDLEDNYINSGQSLGQTLIYPSESELEKLLVQLSTFLSPRLSSRDLHPSDQVFEQEIHNRVSRQLATTCNKLIEYQRTRHYYRN